MLGCELTLPGFDFIAGCVRATLDNLAKPNVISLWVILLNLALNHVDQLAHRVGTFLESGFFF